MSLYKNEKRNLNAYRQISGTEDSRSSYRHSGNYIDLPTSRSRTVLTNGEKKNWKGLWESLAITCTEAKRILKVPHFRDISNCRNLEMKRYSPSRISCFFSNIVVCLLKILIFVNYLHTSVIDHNNCFVLWTRLFLCLCFGEDFDPSPVFISATIITLPLVKIHAGLRIDS